MSICCFNVVAKLTINIEKLTKIRRNDEESSHFNNINKCKLFINVVSS